MRTRTTLLVLWLGISPALAAGAEVRLVLRTVEASTGAAVPARVELLDASGRAWIASDALPIMRECLLAPLPDWLSPIERSRSVYNPYTGTSQFYVDGSARLELEPGTYQLRAWKGPEYRRTERTIQVTADPEQSAEIPLARWADPASEGWFGVDDHLHITRSHPEQNAWLASWMNAEGLHVANLLEMGTAAQFNVTPQYAYGDAGAYRDGALLLAGQEHPRTHFLGHTITLGAEQRVDRRDRYIVYDATFAEGESHGGVSGFAHWGIGAARDGLAISAPTGRVRFVEVLQFEAAYYDVWYQLLNLGLRITPSAGTDFPCGPPSLPGRERVYLHADAPIDREGLVAALRAGRSFVTNGPLIELEAEGAGPGEELQRTGPGPVRLSGRVRYDPAQDRVDLVELVSNGIVVPHEEERVDGEIRISAQVRVERSAWFALRSSGGKLAEGGPMPLRFPDWVADGFSGYVGGGGGPELDRILTEMRERPSAAHTAAVFVRVGAESAPSSDPTVVGEWRERLDALEERLQAERIAEIPIQDWIPYSDGVSEAHLREHRGALLEAIAEARGFYAARESGETSP